MMKIKIKQIQSILLLFLIICMFSDCSNVETPYEAIVQESNIEGEYTENSINETSSTEADTILNTLEVEEIQYPMLLTPTLTSNIEFAIFSEDIFCINNGKKYGYMKQSGEK